jgi:hypothetical protein
MITTTTKHTITVTEKTLLTNLANRFVDILNDSVDDPAIFIIESHRLSGLFNTFEKCGWGEVFNEAMTSLVLPDEDMVYIEEFAQGKKGDGVLEIAVKRENGNTEIVPWDLIQF